MKIVRITQVDFLRVCDWLRGQADELMRERPPNSCLAKRAQVALDIGVTPGAIGRAKRAVGFAWTAWGATIAKRTSPWSPLWVARMSEVEAMASELADKLGQLKQLMSSDQNGGAVESSAD